MAQELAGKTVLVTGAARGIGRQTALEFAGCGADVVLNDLCEDDDLLNLQREAEARGVRAAIAVADVSVTTEAQAMVQTAVSAFGRVDVLINNAAYSVRKSFLDATLEEAAKTLSVTLWGPYQCSYFAAQAMVRHGGGSIVMVGSVHGARPYPNAAAYNMAKAGLVHLGASLALELAPHGVRVNTIEPGWIDTPGEHVHNSSEEMVERGRTLPFGRLGSAAEIAKAAAFLCSVDASYITGATLRVDGGFALKF